MNGLDIAIVLAGLAAFVGGYRSGLIVKVCTLVGLLLGVLAVTANLAEVSRRLDPDADRGPLVVVGAVLGGAVLGRLVGLLFGRFVQRRLPTRPLQTVNRLGGGALGIAGVLAVIWIVTPLFAFVPGWPSEAARGSEVATRLANNVPFRIDVVSSARRVLASGRLPDVFSTLARSPVSGPPPDVDLPDGVVAVASRSVFRVVARGCGFTSAGTAFAVGPRALVTNAHVVAGANDVVIENDSGRSVVVDVVGFDPSRDLALLRPRTSTPGSLLTSMLALAETTGATESAVVLGHPGGGPLRVGPARAAAPVVAQGRDIYARRRSERSVTVLAAELHPGDSGAPVVDARGTVIAVVFAVAPDEPTTAYGLAPEELRAFLDTIPIRTIAPVPTGSCLA